MPVNPVDSTRRDDASLPPSGYLWFVAGGFFVVLAIIMIPTGTLLAFPVCAAVICYGVGRTKAKRRREVLRARGDG